MENNIMGREFNWDDTIENDSEFVLLPEGDYDFTVKRFERGRHPGSAKLPACNKAVLEIEVTDGKNKSTIRHNLFLHSNCEGMLCEFFTAIGQRRRGEPLRMRWNEVVGSRGRCKVIVDTFQNRNTGEEMKSNKIRKFYEPRAAVSPSTSEKAHMLGGAVSHEAAATGAKAASAAKLVGGGSGTAAGGGSGTAAGGGSGTAAGGGSGTAAGGGFGHSPAAGGFGGGFGWGNRT